MNSGDFYILNSCETLSDVIIKNQISPITLKYLQKSFFIPKHRLDKRVILVYGINMDVLAEKINDKGVYPQICSGNFCGR